MKKIFIIIVLITFNTSAIAINKNKIIKNFDNIKNVSFNFEQNINGKIEKGYCKLQYPKKIFCKYDLENQKILVSNGRSLVIKTKDNFFLYPLDKTPLNLILDKEFLIQKIKNLDERIIEDQFINYKFSENDNEINIFFSKKNFNLIGWQTLDMYQNLSITFLSSIIKNQSLEKNLFNLPKQN